MYTDNINLITCKITIPLLLTIYIEIIKVYVRIVRPTQSMCRDI